MQVTLCEHLPPLELARLSQADRTWHAAAELFYRGRDRREHWNTYYIGAHVGDPAGYRVSRVRATHVDVTQSGPLFMAGYRFVKGVRRVRWILPRANSELVVPLLPLWMAFKVASAHRPQLARMFSGGRHLGRALPTLAFSAVGLTQCWLMLGKPRKELRRICGTPI